MTNLIAFMFQDNSQAPSGGGAGAALGAGFMIVWLLVVVLMVAAMWKIFVKAGKPGWAAIVPIYNLIVLLEIAGKPLWWFILLLIPIVGVIVAIMVFVEIAKKFGKGVGFAIGMLILPFIFLPMLAWGDAQYNAAA